MAQLTQTQRRQLEAVLSNLRRGIAYLNRPQVLGIAEAIEEKNARGDDYDLRNPACMASCTSVALHMRTMNKSIGSDIAGLYQALTLLDELLNPPRTEEEAQP
jgi:hypothetical protein